MTTELISTNDKNMANGMRNASNPPLSESEIEYSNREKTYHTISHQSIMLAKQARLEQQKNGYVTVICPKCQKHPEITMTSKSERTIISCPCGYVKNIEINF